MNLAGTYPHFLGNYVDREKESDKMGVVYMCP